MIHLYRRVSTTEQHNGPLAQIDAMTKWLSGQTNNEHMDFFDDGVSGSVPLGERPAGKSMIGHFSMFDDNVVVVTKLDRLFRSTADAATTIDNWCSRGIKLVSITEGFDATTVYGKMICHIMSALAQMERELIKERTKAALAAKKARGECIGDVPYGWYKDPVSGMLLTHVTEQKVIGRIMVMYGNEMKTAAAIASYLNYLGWRAKKGGRWSKTQVQRVIDRALKA